MRTSGLSRREAMQLITPVVDGEATAREQAAFFEYIKKDPKVERLYRAERQVKNLMHDRCPQYKAPDHLKKRINNLLSEQPDEISKLTASTNRMDLTEMMCALSEPPARCSPKTKREETLSQTVDPAKPRRTTTYLSMAAALVIVLVISISSGLLKIGPLTSNPDLDQHVYRHYTTNKAGFVMPTLSTPDVTEAEEYVLQRFKQKVTVPQLNGTTFQGVVWTEFVPEYNTPMLEYYHEGRNAYIYVFAFNLDQLNTFPKLKRYNLAVESCQSAHDYFVHEVEDAHVVSWKWGSTWYAAISKLKGNQVASLVPQLQTVAKRGISKQ